MLNIKINVLREESRSEQNDSPYNPKRITINDRLLSVNGNCLKDRGFEIEELIDFKKIERSLLITLKHSEFASSNPDERYFLIHEDDNIDPDALRYESLLYPSSN
ncbi:hypothetical protein KUTeg_007461 [Tegillarca granosa]|uniref:PDZ domain-containing protein n=1 Tax=Tegillarca granosa TaxID=220873 RepID=A0ABQ9FGN2_TEGGR|nr:hypothetical protein KUTeg_007461 [Tegillarca granosa]